MFSLLFWNCTLDESKVDRPKAWRKHNVNLGLIKGVATKGRATSADLLESSDLSWTQKLDSVKYNELFNDNHYNQDIPIVQSK